MIEKIAHISDVHIRKNPDRNQEYYLVFDELYESLKINKPDRIVLTGDIVNDYIDLQGEQLILLSDFFENLAKLADKVIVMRGNHDYQKKNINRVDSIEAVLKTIKNNKIVYYNETGFYDDENVTWAVWKHGDKKISPWKLKSKKYNKENTVIDLFHNTVNGCVNNSNYEFKSSKYVSIKDLKGDYSFLGHIHKQQFLDKNKTKAYPSSLIAQKYDEGDDNFHGYIMWDIKNKNNELIPIKNKKFSFKNVIVNSFTDFDDLDIDIDDPTENMRVRIIWRTLPYIKSNENIITIKNYLKNKYDNILSISNKEEFLEDDKISIIDDEVIKDINNVEVQENVFREYLETIGVEDEIINEVLKINDEIDEKIETQEFTNIEWDIVRFGAENFMSYKKFDIDWYDKNGIYQINGKNTGGKTNILKSIPYTAYGKTPETETPEKFGDLRYINNRIDADFCNAYLILEANAEFYGLKRETIIDRKKNGEIKNVSSDLFYYKLSSPYDQLTDEHSIENLTDKDKNKTKSLINKIIGDYDNFMRVVFTTSDTLNGILSNNMSKFIDSLLFDSGLDIFDKKLTEFKKYQKNKRDNVPRINCDINSTDAKISNYIKNNEELTSKIDKYNKDIDQTKENIIKGNKFIDEISNKLYEIDESLYNLDIEDVKNKINISKNNLKDLNTYISRENKKMDGLVEKYDEDRYNELEKKIENFKENINSEKIIKNNKLNEKSNIEHSIQLLNGDIFKLKNEGVVLKEEFEKFKNSPICPTCNQKIVGDEHKDIYQKTLNDKKSKIIEIANKIKSIQNVDIVEKNDKLKEINKNIEDVEGKIVDLNLQMDNDLKELGILTNNKNDVLKRKEIMSNIENSKLKIEIEENKINNLNNQKESFNNNLKMIDENKKNNKILSKARDRMTLLNDELLLLNDKVSECKNDLKNNNNKIKELRDLIKDFKLQQKNDKIEELYKKCVHRDGIPRQMLSNYIIPKINEVLKDQLNDMNFIVWLDENDFKPKLTYKNNSKSTINAIGSSGKERTFSSLSLKQALININKKSKPKIFLLDEVTGKLVDESVEEFISFIKNISNRVNKLVIIEHTHEIEPDYIIDVVKDEYDVSSLSIL